MSESKDSRKDKKETKKETKEDEAKERPRFRNIAKKIFGESDSPPEGRDILGAVWETGDKAKTEVVRLVAREVRGYLDALEIHKDLRTLLTDYSLEVKASFHLKPLKEEESESLEEPKYASTEQSNQTEAQPVELPKAAARVNLQSDSEHFNAEGGD